MVGRRGLANAGTHVGLLALTNNLIAYHRAIENDKTETQTTPNPVAATTSKLHSL